MPGTQEIVNEFDHQLQPVKGWFDVTVSLDKDGKLKAGETPVAGMSVYMDANKEFVPGLEDGAMAVFIRQAHDSFDVDGPVGNIISQKMSGLVVSGGFEIATTEYISDTYAPNEPLTVQKTGADRGKVRKATGLYEEDVVGIVSDGIFQEDMSKKNMLQFWTVYLPANPLNASSSSSSSSAP